MNSQIETKRQARTAIERIGEIQKAMTTLNILALSLSLLTTVSLSFSASVIFDVKPAITILFVFFACGVGWTLYASTVRTIQVLVTAIVKTLGESPKVRDRKTGRFVPINTMARRGKKSYVVVEE